MGARGLCREGRDNFCLKRRPTESTLAPASTSAPATSTWPLNAAAASGVKFCLLVASVSAPTTGTRCEHHGLRTKFARV